MKSSTKKSDKMLLAEKNANAAEDAVQKEAFYVMVSCDNPRCDNYLEPVNSVTGFESSADVDAFMEGWDPEDDEADVCVVCGQPGCAEGFGADDESNVEPAKDQ